MKTYKELLPTRIPEYMQGDNNLREFLEVAGELFDEFSGAIEEFDHVWDSEKVSNKRLQDLATQFSLEFPRNLNEELQRVIVRDLEAIYQKSGAIPLINWIFRLIGWDIDVEYAWLLNPEKYDPQIKTVFNLDDYGREQSPTIITDYDRRDYRDFLIGGELVNDNGTYFRGRRFFDQRDTFLKNEIVGEWYDHTQTRTADKVGATPYVFIRVSEDDYNIFIAPYEDPETGIIYEYTQTEFFQIVGNILNFFLFDEMRPTHVRVVIIVTAQRIDDAFVVTDDYTDELTSDPVEIEDKAAISEKEESVLYMDIDVGPLFISGAPPHPFSKDMVISSIGYRNMINHDLDYYVDHQERNYTVLQEEDYPVPRAGGTSFRFITPHEDRFWFRRVYYGQETELDPLGEFGGSTYPDDSADLRLSFEVGNSRYGIIDEQSSQSIIVRNPTEIDSPNFNPPTKPTNAFDLGNKILVGGEEQFDSNVMMSFDFRAGGELLANQSEKTFYYIYDMTIYTKESNIEAGWAVLANQPKVGDVNTLTNSNALALRFNEPIPYDFILNVEYQEQPPWENRY